MRDSVKSIYESGAKARSLMTNVWSHDIVERMKIRRKVMAKDCGLGDIDVGTYPSHPATIINQSSSLLPIIAGLGILGGGVAGGMGLAGAFDRDPVPVVAPAVIEKTGGPIEFDLEILGTDDGIKARIIE
jgi:hypothetical protein